MWAISREKAALIIATIFVAIFIFSTARAQTNSHFYNTTTQQGLYLPPVPTQHGFDEVRGPDGTMCRSSMGSNGAVLDIGAITNNTPDGEAPTAGVYGRIVMPLGHRPRRLDCSKLYELEVERLRHELKLVRMGLSSGPLDGASTLDGEPPAWQTEGWSTPKAQSGRDDHKPPRRRADNSEITVPKLKRPKHDGSEPRVRDARNAISQTPEKAVELKQVAGTSLRPLVGSTPSANEDLLGKGAVGSHEEIPPFNTVVRSALGAAMPEDR